MDMSSMNNNSWSIASKATSSKFSTEVECILGVTLEVLKLLQGTKLLCKDNKHFKCRPHQLQFSGL